MSLSIADGESHPARAQEALLSQETDTGLALLAVTSLASISGKRQCIKAPCSELVVGTAAAFQSTAVHSGDALPGTCEFLGILSPGRAALCPGQV